MHLSLSPNCFIHDLSLMKILDLLAGVRLRNKIELLQRSQGTFLSRLINNLAALQSEDSDSREVDFFAGVGVV